MNKSRRLEIQVAHEAEKVERQKQNLVVNPLKLLKLLARVKTYEYFYTNEVTFTTDDKDPNFVKLEFVFLKSREQYQESFELTVYSDDYEFKAIETYFDKYDAEVLEVKRKLQLARSTYDSLTPEQRDALGLLQRP